MRMTDEQLEAHLNKHQNRKNEVQQPSKQQFDARVLGRLKQGYKTSYLLIETS